MNESYVLTQEDLDPGLDGHSFPAVKATGNVNPAFLSSLWSCGWQKLLTIKTHRSWYSLALAILIDIAIISILDPNHNSHNNLHLNPSSSVLRLLTNHSRLSHVYRRLGRYICSWWCWHWRLRLFEFLSVGANLMIKGALENHTEAAEISISPMIFTVDITTAVSWESTTPQNLQYVWIIVDLARHPWQYLAFGSPIPWWCTRVFPQFWQYIAMVRRSEGEMART